MKIVIRDNEMGFVTKNGSFVKTIKAGTYHFSKRLGYEVEVEEMDYELDYDKIPYQVMIKDSEFADSTVKYDIPDGYIGYLYKNGKLLRAAVQKTEYVFWNVFDKYEIKLFSMEEDRIANVSKKMLDYTPVALYTTVSVGEGEKAILYVNNIRKEILEKGVYSYWNYNKKVTFNIYDTRQEQLDIAGQEILTKDKIGIRMNVACVYKIADVVTFSEKVTNIKEQLYAIAQLAIREIVGRYKLDEILELKETISKEIYEAIKQSEDMFCIEIITAGIKDIILPGEIREIMNSVLVAEKKAQANVIARREEVASTRSLLNTAKLMDENKTLYKLKELEYLERICDRVGDISINGNAGIVEQLGTLMG